MPRFAGETSFRLLFALLLFSFLVLLLLSFFLILHLLSFFHDGLKRKSMCCSDLERLLSSRIMDEDDLPQFCETEAVNVCREVTVTLKNRMEKAKLQSQMEFDPLI